MVGEWRIESSDLHYDIAEGDHPARRARFALLSGACVHHGLDLKGKLSISGKLTGKAGRPVTAAILALDSPRPDNGVENNANRAWTGDSGEFTFRGLRSKCYYLAAMELGSGAPEIIFYPGVLNPALASCVEPREETLAFCLPSSGDATPRSNLRRCGEAQTGGLQRPER